MVTILSKYFAVAGGEDGKQRSRLDKLFARVNETVLHAERVAPLGEIRELCRDPPGPHELVLSDFGLELVVGLLRSPDDEMDDRTVASLLQVLLLLLDPAEAGRARGGEEQAIGKVKAENLARFLEKSLHVTSLLDLLRRPQNNVRLGVLQLLLVLLGPEKAAQGGRRDKLQAAVLGYPMGVNLLLELLKVNQDLIRNPTLLVLEKLAKDNNAVQTILVFNGALDLLLSVASDEDTPPVIVEDSLRVLRAVFKDNTSAQSLFAEFKGFAKLAPLLTFVAVTVTEEPDQALSAESRLPVLLLLLLEIVEDLSTQLSDSGLLAEAAADAPGAALADPAPALAEKARALQTGMGELVPGLTRLALACREPTARRLATALLPAILYAHPRNQYIFACQAIPALQQRPEDLQRFPLPPVQPHLTSWQGEVEEVGGPLAMLRCALFASDTLDAAAAQHLLACFLKHNTDAQRGAAHSFSPIPAPPTTHMPLPEQAVANGITLPEPLDGQGGMAGFGSMVLTVLLDDSRPLLQRCRSLQVLVAILGEDEGTKLLLAQLPLEIPDLRKAAPPHQAQSQNGAADMTQLASSTKASGGGDTLPVLPDRVFALLQSFRADRSPGPQIDR